MQKQPLFGIELQNLAWQAETVAENGEYSGLM